jgi:hypothetical protein
MTNLLKEIWSKVPKEIHNGEEFIRYKTLDVPILYLMRIADPKKCTIQEWVNEFKDSQQRDGSYLVSREQFMAKEKLFNTKTPSRAPFDASAIQEGHWSEADLDHLYFERIREETVLSDGDWEVIKSRIRNNEGKLSIDKSFKKELGYVLKHFSSAMRNKSLHLSRTQSRATATVFSKGSVKAVQTTNNLQHLISKRRR